MSVDLGKYAFDVLLAYGLGLFLLVLLVVVSMFQARGAARGMKQAEDRTRKEHSDV